jgi:hypothetical protein
MPATSTTTTADQIFTGIGGATGSSTPGKAAAPPAMEFGRVYGLLAVLGSIFAGFMLL